MIIKNLLLLSFLILSYGYVYSQNVGINNAGTAPDPSAGLEINFNDKGFLPPRLTTAQRDAIVSPAEGLVIFNTETYCYEGYNGTAWSDFGCLPNPTLDFCAGDYTITHNGFVYSGVTNPTTGKCWLDRNLGATQVATSSTDVASYGDLYQWGRGADGHQLRVSGTGVLSYNDTPGHGNFIITSSSPYDWRSPRNDNLWQGEGGINNPCPSGFRLPTNTELDAERQSWATNNAAGAFGSPLKLPLAGHRLYNSALLDEVGSRCYYWSSTVNSNEVRALHFHSSNANISSNYRARGFSVRCLKD